MVDVIDAFDYLCYDDDDRGVRMMFIEMIFMVKIIFIVCYLKQASSQGHV
jgi:hypothetical protein